MYWRMEKGEDWISSKGPRLKRRFKRLVRSRRALGVLAFADGEPVGWVAFGPRTEFARLDRSPSFVCDDADAVWSINCFFVNRAHRRRGVATALLRAAVRAARRRSARIVEGYPVKPTRPGRPVADAFAWTGTRPLFAAAGFRVVEKRPKGKQRVRKEFV